MKRKILLYGDVDLNIVDGSSIWLVNLAKLLLLDKDNEIDILLKKRIRNKILVNDIEKRYRIKILYVKEYLDHISEVDQTNINHVIETIDTYRDYSCIIVRGLNVVKQVYKSSIIKKVIPYLTDFCHDENKISTEQKDFLKSLYQKVNAYFVQTKAMKEYLERILDVDGKKFYILYPVVFDKEKGIKNDKTIIYAGKIAKDWNIVELIEIMKKIYEVDPTIQLHFIGDKFNRDMANRKNEILSALENAQNIKFYGSLPHDDVDRIMKTCELGYSYRKTKIDNDSSLEVSVKLLEYCHNEVPMLLRRTKMHEYILGKDYPLYVSSSEECYEKILKVFSNHNEYQKAKDCLKHACELFNAKKIYENIKPALCLYPKKQLRLLISGHDLKFIEALFPYFKRNYIVKVQRLDEYMELDIKECKKLIKQVDIIWCEWLLTSAWWYTNNALPHQSLFVRAHRFEINRKYGNQIDINKLTCLITVSYYWFEEFTRKFNIPYNKATVINNYIDVDNYNQNKDKDSQYHIALIGALPKRKGLSRAIDILKKLKEKDSRYTLHVVGKRPEEFPNTWNVEEEKQYYLGVYQRIKDEHLEDSVIFEGWVYIPDYLSKIGYVLSLSDNRIPESFHLSPLEGMTSLGVALLLKWEGIEYIYPESQIFDSCDDIVQMIDYLNRHPSLYHEYARRGYQFVKNHYNIDMIYDDIHQLLETGGDYEEFNY